MLRTNLITSVFLLCSLAASVADEDAGSKTTVQSDESATSSPTSTQTSRPQSVLKNKLGIATLGESNGSSELAPAVHINGSGPQSGYETRRSNNSTVNRLRAVKDSVFVSPNTGQPAQLGTASPGTLTAVPSGENPNGESAEGSSRRKPPRPADPSKVVPSKQVPALPGVAEPDKTTLPSVVTSRPQSAKPADARPAEPQAALTEAPVKPSPADAFSAPQPQLDIPAATAAPSVAEPRKSESILAVPPKQSQQSAVRNQENDLLAVEIPAGQPLTTPVLNPEIPFAEVNIGPPVSAVSESDAHRTPAQPANPLAKPPLETFRLGQMTENSSVLTTKTPQTTPPQATAPQATAPRIVDRPKDDSKPATGETAQSKQEDILLSNRSPILVVKTHGQQTIRVGRVATYYVTAANVGDLAAEDVTVDVNVPNWAEITRNHASSGMVRVEPSTNGDNILRWSIRDLKPKNEQRLRLDLVPKASRPIELGVTWNFKSVSAMAQIEVQEPKLHLSVVGPSDIQFGETKLYTITVSNPGTGSAENVSLSLLPLHEGAGMAGVRELGTIEAGTRRTIEVELTANQAGELAVRAVATADGNLETRASQAVRVRRANLMVQTSGPTRKYSGTPARYLIKVTNNGDATAEDVVAVAALPMAARYVKSTNGGSFDSERGRVRWSIGALRPGAFKIVEVTTVLVGSGANRIDVRSAAAGRLTAAGGMVTQVEAQADLKMIVEDPPGVNSLNTELTYEVHIINRGTKAANDVNVVGYFSEGIEPVAVQGWQADVEIGQIVLDTIPRISPGQEIVVKVIAKADRAGNHVFRAELDTKDPPTKLAQEEWTVFHGGLDEQFDGHGIQQADNSSESQILAR